MEYEITGSIVTYKSNLENLSKTIQSFLSSRRKIKLYIIDNSPSDDLRDSFNDNRIKYIFNNKNLGFGRAHNIALKESLINSKYHVVLNPDIEFDGAVLDKIYDYMEQNMDVGQIMPKVLYPNGNVQFLCKLLPEPTDLLFRRFIPGFPGAKEKNERYELRKSGYNKIMNIPYLSGCFMFFRTKSVEKVGLFDERIFMYIEDADITRRMHREYKTLFLPEVTIIHNYEKGSYKSLKLMLFNIHGAFIYFTKWGWFFDIERRRINDNVVKSYLK